MALFPLYTIRTIHANFYSSSVPIERKLRIWLGMITRFFHNFFIEIYLNTNFSGSSSGNSSICNSSSGIFFNIVFCKTKKINYPKYRNKKMEKLKINLPNYNLISQLCYLSLKLLIVSNTTCKYNYIRDK